MGAEDGVTLVPGVVERLGVVSQPLFPSCGTDSDVSFHLLLVVHSGFDHSRLVDVVLGEAPALKGALASLPSPSWTIYKYVYIYVELIYNTVLAFKKAQYVYMC